MEGKTTLAWSLVRFLRGMGHNVEIDTKYHSERVVIEGDDNYTPAIEPREVIVSTDCAKRNESNGIEISLEDIIEALASAKISWPIKSKTN